MAFYRSLWLPKLTERDIPDNLSLYDFLFDDHHRPRPCSKSPAPFIDSDDGRGYSLHEVKQRVEWLAAGLADQLKVECRSQDIWKRVIAVFTPNNIHAPVLAWAAHRIDGVVAPVNQAFQASEVAYQLKDSAACCLFTCKTHLATALSAAKQVGLSPSRVFLILMPFDKARSSKESDSFLTLDELIERGSKLAPLPRALWQAGRGGKQAAYLCYSSGTSGRPKGVMISHRNIIANVLQVTLLESTFRPKTHQDVILGALPQSHIYSIILTTHVPVFRGDTVITMAKFELTKFLQAVDRFQMTLLYVVPPMLVALAKMDVSTSSTDSLKLSSVQRIFCGAAPLSMELTSQIKQRYPRALLGQGYGMTETATVVAQHPRDVYDGSSGCIVPGLEIKIVDTDGRVVTQPNERGELFVKGPNVTLGYYKNEKATRETYLDGWLRTGDEVEIGLHPITGDPHLFVVDRVKELIKVSGFQVAPAELEGHLLGHPLVADCAVIPVLNDISGEVPKALVVLKDNDVSHDVAGYTLSQWVSNHKSKHKQLRGGIEFISEIPKSPSGKILRRLLRDRERAKSSTGGGQISARL